VGGRELRRRRGEQRTVPERGEVAAPGLDGAEQAWVPERDVERAEAAGREAADRAPPRRAYGRQVTVDPRDDRPDDVVLPRSRPLAAVAAVRPAGRPDGDQGPSPPRDQRY